MPEQDIRGHKYKCTVNVASAGQRLDKYICGPAFSCDKAIEPPLTRSQAQRLIRGGLVRVNQRQAKPGYLLREGDAVEVVVPSSPEYEVAPENIELEIIYEDENLVVVNKPPGMVVHPAPGNPCGTLVNALLNRYGALPDIGAKDRPGIIHRLDKGTSGLIVVARDYAAHRCLARQFMERKVFKEYVALVRGELRQDQGNISLPLGRHTRERKRMAVRRSGGRQAETEYRVLERFDGFTLLKVWPKTGRTHQVRIHLAHFGHPIVGDVVYGGRTASEKKFRRKIEELGRPALHAMRLGFTHPSGGHWLEVSAPLPPDIEQLLDSLRKARRNI